jgi:hypothetical protein
MDTPLIETEVVEIISIEEGEETQIIEGEVAEDVVGLILITKCSILATTGVEETKITGATEEVNLKIGTKTNTDKVMCHSTHTASIRENSNSTINKTSSIKSNNIISIKSRSTTAINRRIIINTLKIHHNRETILRINITLKIKRSN